MNKILIIAALICLVASQDVKKCTEDLKNTMCPMVEDPVCGIKNDGRDQKKETFSNHCIACSTGNFDFTVGGRCEDFPNEAYFCHPDAAGNKICTLELDPQCGWYNQSVKCIKYPCAINGSNRCQTCSIENVLYLTGGQCPEK